MLKPTRRNKKQDVENFWNKSRGWPWGAARGTNPLIGLYLLPLKSRGYRNLLKVRESTVFLNEQDFGWKLGVFEKIWEIYTTYYGSMDRGYVPPDDNWCPPVNKSIMVFAQLQKLSTAIIRIRVDSVIFLVQIGTPLTDWRCSRVVWESWLPAIRPRDSTPSNVAPQCPACDCRQR